MRASSSSFGWSDAPGTIVAAVSVLVGLTVLAAFFDVAQRPFLTAGLLVLLAGVFLVAVWSTWNASPSRSILLIVAMLLRLVAFGLPPTLSDDVARYIWDGRVLVAGFNPYTQAPSSPELEGLRDASWRTMPHRDVETVYPPVALGFFSIAALSAHPLLAWRAILLAAEAISCWLILVLLQRRRLPSGRAVGYLWSPLVVIETTGMGHVDTLGIALLLGAVALADRAPRDLAARRAVGAALLLCASVATKLVPLLLVPLWTRLSPRSRVFALACGVVLGGVALPVLWSSGGAPPGLVTYGLTWEFNGPLFEPLWRLIDVSRLDSAAKMLVGLVGGAGLSEIVEPLYAFLYPQFLARFSLLLALSWVVLRSSSRSISSRDLVGGSLEVLAAMILFSATVYPWYVLWTLPFACVAGRRVWLVLSASSLAAYAPVLFDIELFPWAYLMVWMPPLLYRVATRRVEGCDIG